MVKKIVHSAKNYRVLKSLFHKNVWSVINDRFFKSFGKFVRSVKKTSFFFISLNDPFRLSIVRFFRKISFVQKKTMPIFSWKWIKCYLGFFQHSCFGTSTGEVTGTFWQDWTGTFTHFSPSIFTGTGTHFSWTNGTH